jgi:uncharacterized protein
VRSLTRAPARILSAIVTAAIRLYQTLVSPLLGPRCRYSPTCSSYAIDAVRSFGILRGTVLAGWRLLRCNPWSAGGFDPVEQQRLFRPRHSEHRDTSTPSQP